MSTETKNFSTEYSRGRLVARWHETRQPILGQVKSFKPYALLEDGIRADLDEAIDDEMRQADERFTVTGIYPEIEVAKFLDDLDLRK
jgi:hypothetical protein